MLTFIYNAFTLSTLHSLMQCACTESLPKSSGLWADSTPQRGRESISYCLAIPVEGQKRVQGATHFHGEISLSYLRMPATGRIKKGPPSTQKLCRKPPAEREESRSQVPPHLRRSEPTFTSSSGQSWHQAVKDVLSLDAAGEESRFGNLLRSLGPSSSGCWALLSGALLGCAFFGHDWLL